MARPARHRAAVLILAMCASALLLGAACNPSAAERLNVAAGQISRTVGRSVDDVIRALRNQLRGATDEQIAAEAERAAQATKNVELTAAALAAQSEIRAKKVQAYYNAACDWLGFLKSAVFVPEQQRTNALDMYVANRLAEQGLDSSQLKVKQLRDAILTQKQSLETSGSLSVPDLLSDFGCIFTS